MQRSKKSHFEDTPNQEDLDWIVERIREIYNYENLKDCDIDFLHNLEFLIDSKLLIFKAGYPDDNRMPDEFRAIAQDQNIDELKDALTSEEKIRLQLLREEAAVEIHRAFGHRKELRRKHRNRIANTIADAIKAIANLFPW